MRYHWSRFRIWLFFAVAALAVGTAGAQTSISLSGVPDRLSLPAPAGMNIIITARIEGEAVKAVWMATSRDAAVRVMLSRARENEYQVNLADETVSALLKAEGSGGQFSVFAETARGEVVSSVPVRYTFGPGRVPSVEVYVLFQDGRRESVADWPEPFSRFQHRAECWCVPEDVRLIEIRCIPHVASLTAEVHTSVNAHAMEGVPGRPEFARFELTDDVRREWRMSGRLRVLYRKEGERSREAVLRAIPAGLDISDTPHSFVIYQRTKKSVPGSSDYLQIRLGDITGGHVVLSMTSPDDRTIVEERLLRQGDCVRFQLGGEEFVVSLEKLVNVLIGDDYAEFTLRRLDVKEESAWIDSLLDSLKSSGALFIRNGKEYSGKEAADHLRSKWEARRSEIATIEEFIRKIATRSSTTGEEYRVKEGETISRSADWMRRKMEALKSAVAQPGKGEEGPDQP